MDVLRLILRGEIKRRSRKLVMDKAKSGRKGNRETKQNSVTRCNAYIYLFWRVVGYSDHVSIISQSYKIILICLP